ncbi:MAG: response regulator [Opitutaceae bacterium]|nr:response regulator [Opitutaceae bacterium]
MNILHLEDSPEDAELVHAILAEEWPGCRVSVVAHQEDFIQQLDRGGFDVILSDFTLATFNGLDALKLARARQPETPFIFLSGTIGEDRALEAVQAGAMDYVLKDRMKRLGTAVQNALRESQERKQRQLAEAALHRFAAILENTPDFVSMTDLTGRVFFINHAGLAMLGRPVSQDPGLLSLEDFYPAASGERIMREYLPLALRDGMWLGEATLQAGDGRLIPVSQLIIAHQTAEGRPEYLSTVMRDLTPYKEAERRISAQAGLINKAREAIILTDLDGRITFWNQGAELISGWTALEAVGRPFAEIFGADIKGDLATVRQSVDATDEWRGELQLRNKSDQLRMVEISVSLIRDEADQPTARLSIGTDVTEKKAIEEQFLRAQRIEGIGMLAAGIAHDLNNVLAPILMAVPMLRDRASDPADLRLLNNLERSAERGAGLVRQILSFAHGVSGEFQLLQIRHIVRDLSAVICQTFPKNIRLEEEMAGELWAVRGNPTQIHQMLLNLCINARDAMPNGGRLRLQLQNLSLDALAASALEGAQPGPYLLIQVADTGTGIPPEVLTRIWEPFFTTKGTHGTGLGLGTVRGLVKDHGGFITVKTEPGRGTSFDIYLPAIEAAFADKTPPVETAVPRGQGELILVVDDELSVREVTTAILANQGYRVLSASDGTEAVAILAPRSSEVRLMVTDLQMPHLDGLALARVVQRLNPAIKIVTASGMGSSRSIAAAKLASDAFLMKPFKALDLLAIVQKLLNEPAKRNEPGIEI